MSLLLADDVSTSQESMEAATPETPQSPHAAAPKTPQSPHADTPTTPQHATSKVQDGQEEGNKRVEALVEVEASPKGEVVGHEISNHSGSGKKGKMRGVKALPQVKESPKVSGTITGSYAVLESEQEHLTKAAVLAIRAQEATQRHRLRQKTTSNTSERPDQGTNRVSHQGGTPSCQEQSSQRHCRHILWTQASKDTRSCCRVCCHP